MFFGEVLYCDKEVSDAFSTAGYDSILVSSCCCKFLVSKTLGLGFSLTGGGVGGVGGGR